MKQLIRVASAASLFFCISAAQAAVTPVGIGIFAPVQFPPSDFTVVGARANLFIGNHRYVYGLDVGGIGNVTQQSFAGIGIAGIYNLNKGAANILGLQAAGITNINQNKLRVLGVQVAGIVNSNAQEGTLIGLQVAPIANLSQHMTIGGLQVGLYNKAKEVYGFQIGLINFVDSLHGLQIGLLNFHKTGLFSVSPIINIGF